MKIPFGIIAGTMTIISPSFAANVGLAGSQVTITGYCCTAPIPSNAFTEPKTETVNAGVEFPTGSIITTTRSIITSNVNISNFAIDIRYTQTATAAIGAFNGFGFDFSGGSLLPIVGVSLNPASTFSPAQIGLTFDNDSVFFSGAGLNYTPSSRVLIDIAFAPVPVPAASLMMTTGALLLAGRWRAQRRTTKAHGPGNPA